MRYFDGNWEQWLAEHGEKLNDSSEVMTYTNPVNEEETSAWIPVGIGVGGTVYPYNQGYYSSTS